MKKITAMLLAVFTAVFCCTSCGSSNKNEPADSAPTASSDQEETEASSDTDKSENTTEKSTETTTTKATTTAQPTEEVTTQPREGAAPFGDFYDVRYYGDADYGSGSETITFAADNTTFSFDYADELNVEKRIRLSEFFNRCSYPDYSGASTGGDTPPWLQTGSSNVSSIQFMAKNDKEMRFILFASDTACLTYICSAYDEEKAGNSSVLTLKSPEIHKYSIDFEYMRSNIEDIIGSGAVSSSVSEGFSLFKESDIYFNFSPYYHPENMTLYPENPDDPFGAFSIPNYGAFQVEKNTDEAISILNRRTYTKITNSAEIPAQAKGSDIEKCYKLGGNPGIAAKSDRTYDQAIIMCNSSRGYYIINIVSGRNAVVSFARYEFRTEGDKKICTNMDEVKSGHNIEWYRCDGDLAGEIRKAVNPNES